MGGSLNKSGGIALRRVILFLVLAMMLVAATSVGAIAQEAQEANPPTPECGWYENPERGWGWDYWCYHPTQLFWVPAFFGVTFDDVEENEGTPLLPTPTCSWYDNPQRGWGWDYWCSHPTERYWEPVFVGVTFD
jgi:hypothetical protein